MEHPHDPSTDTPALPSLRGLKRAPDDWIDNHAKRLAALDRTSFSSPVQWPALPPIEQPDLPTLRDGIDILPERCKACGGRLAIEASQDSTASRLLCSHLICQRQAAWVVIERMLTAPMPISIGIRWLPLSEPRPVVVRRPLYTIGIQRTAGCGRQCSEMYGHDAIQHEQYGRTQLLAEQAARYTATVRTGGLTIDLDTGTVLIDDRTAHLTPMEYATLAYLAQYAGQVCTLRQIVEYVWDVPTADEWEKQRTLRNSRNGGRWHSLRVHMHRLRGRLCPYAGLIETVPARGLRLRVEPPTGE